MENLAGKHEGINVDDAAVKGASRFFAASIFDLWLWYPSYYCVCVRFLGCFQLMMVACGKDIKTGHFPGDTGLF